MSTEAKNAVRRFSKLPRRSGAYRLLKEMAEVAGPDNGLIFIKEETLARE